MTVIPKPPKGHFNLLYFASATSFTAKEFEAFPAPLPLKKLFPFLEERYSGITRKVLDSCLVTINMNYVDMPSEGDTDKASEETVIKEGDEVAIIPPVSSG